MLTEISFGGGLLEVATAFRPHPASMVCGDASLAVPTRTGALLAVVDGLGHGDEARYAAELAVTTVREQAECDLESILAACQMAVRRSRGCVIGLVTIAEDAAELQWAGVGNVEGVVWAAGGGRCRLIGRPGIVGMGLHRVRIANVPFALGDVLALATDGVNPAGLDTSNVRAAVADTAAAILADHARGDDDALVLVARRPARSHQPAIEDR